MNIYIYIYYVYIYMYIPGAVPIEPLTVVFWLDSNVIVLPAKTMKCAQVSIFILPLTKEYSVSSQEPLSAVIVDLAKTRPCMTDLALSEIAAFANILPRCFC
jgi:hypothetical protein